MSSELAVKARGLSKTYPKGTTKALDAFDLDVPTGQVVGLLGPNGSGKTTAVRILSTILAPDAGSATIMGYDVVKDASAVRRLIGLAGQFSTVDENLTGLENLEMVGKLCHLAAGSVKPRAIELLGQFGLAGAGARNVKTYSGGMRRRLDLAAALVARPPVIFLDEPTTGLDPQSRVDASSSELLGLSLREPSLDDVFLELTGQRTDVDIEGLAAGQSEGKKKSRRRVKESS